MTDLITDHMDIWTGAQIQKTNGGRGPGKNGNGQPIYGIKKLRELILELAVRGKLVPQDPGDEPASRQLKNLKNMQKQLIDAGKAKRMKKHQNLGEAEGYYEIPDSWAWEFLANIPLWPIKDGDWVESKDQNPDGNVRLVQLADVGDRVYRNKSSRFMTSAKAEKLNCTYLEIGDVLIARLPDPLGRACIFPGDEKPCVTVVDVAICRCSNDFFYNNYLLIVQNSSLIRKKIEEYATGTTRKRVSTGNLGRLRIPTPPLAEQHRIVAKVDELMALCDQLEQQQTDNNGTHQTLVETLLTSLTTASDPNDFDESWQRIANHFDTLFTTEQSIDHLKQTILQLAVMGRLVPQDPDDEPASVLLEKIAKEKARLVKEGKIKRQKKLAGIGEDEIFFHTPENWEWIRLGASIESMANGIYKPSKFYNDEGVMCLRMYNIKEGEINFENVKRMCLESQEVLQYGLMHGDLLVNRVNSRELVGKAAVVPEISEPLIFESKNIRVRFLPDSVFPNYINIFFRIREVRSVFEGNAKQTCGQASISQPQIQNLAFPLPPLAEQHRIVAKVNELMALCDTLKARLNDAQTTQVELADAIVEQAVA